MTDNAFKQAQQCAITYLARREYARRELHLKLANKGFDSNTIEQVLTQLQRDNLLSEERFIENYRRSRINKGYGPLRIEQELRERGIDGLLLREAMNSSDPEWITRASHVRHQRFGHQIPVEPREKAKQIRFLQYRGFTGDQIKAALSS